MITAVTWPLTIYYDASCPLCEREISMLMAWDRQSHLQLVDCSPPGFTDAHTLEAGLTCNDLMRAIHARDNAGAWYSGIAVFALAYQAPACLAWRAPSTIHVGARIGTNSIRSSPDIACCFRVLV